MYSIVSYIPYISIYHISVYTVYQYVGSEMTSSSCVHVSSEPVLRMEGTANLFILFHKFVFPIR